MSHAAGSMPPEPPAPPDEPVPWIEALFAICAVLDGFVGFVVGLGGFAYASVVDGGALSVACLGTVVGLLSFGALHAVFTPSRGSIAREVAEALALALVTVPPGVALALAAAELEHGAVFPRLVSLPVAVIGTVYGGAAVAVFHARRARRDAAEQAP